MSARVCSASEERFNVVTHAAGLVASLAALPLLVLWAAQQSDALAVVGVLVFGLSLVAVYAASTMYHRVPAGPRKDLWLRLDCAAVYLLIAGTYTPFTLNALRGPWGMGLLTIVWCGALLGIYTKVRFGRRYPTITTFGYLALGWIAVVAMRPLVSAIGWEGFRWIAAGGIAYTVGVVFCIYNHRVRYGHCAWHLFVLAGSACHVIAVVAYGIRTPQ